MSQSTINFQIPVGKFTEDVKLKAEAFGKVYMGEEYAEILCNSMRFAVKDFETYLESNEVPYILHQSGTYCNPPKVKKSNAAVGYCQEFPCYTHTGDEDCDEDGIIKVSELKDLLSSNAHTLAEAIAEMISKRTFVVNTL